MRREKNGIPFLSKITEGENVDVLEKEIPFLREKSRKSAQIDLPIIDFRRRKISVERQDARERGREVVEDIQRRIRLTCRFPTLHNLELPATLMDGITSRPVPCRRFSKPLRIRPLPLRLIVRS